MEGDELIDREDQTRLISESVYSVNPLLPEEIKLIILAKPTAMVLISDQTKSLGICKNDDDFKEDMKQYLTEMRIIFTTTDYKGKTRGREFCSTDPEKDDTYRIALERMVHHGILNTSLDPPEESVEIIEDTDDKNKRWFENQKVKFTVSGAIFFLLALVIVAIIIHYVTQ